MIAKSIVDSDVFLTLPQSTQLLYFHLSIRADDDGFVNNPRIIIRMVGASDEDIKMLILKKFVIAFDDGIVVIKHWRIHNYIRKDTYKETKYKENKKLLNTDENGEYFLCDEPVTNSSRTVDTGKDRIGEEREGKDRIGEGRRGGEKENTNPRTPFGIYRNIFLSEKEYSDLIAEFNKKFIQQEIDNMSEYLQRKSNEGTPITYASYYTKLRKWASEDLAKTEQRKKEASHYYTPTPSKDKKPRFNDYEQRNYTDADIAEIENRMIEKSN